MKTRAGSLAWTVLLAALLVPACSYITIYGPATAVASTPVRTAMVTPMATPDPCAAGNLPVQIQEINGLTRRFDDAAAIARNSKQDQLAPDIAALQSVRRDAEQLQVPACLSHLKDVQLVYMNTFIQTLLGFQSGTGPEQVTQ